jgi:hypothetical protein
MDSVGFFSTTSLDQFVSGAKLQLKIESSDSDIWFIKLANEAIRHLDCYDIFVKKTCSISVINRKAKLPSGFQRLIGLRFGTTNVCSDLVYVDLPFINDCGCSVISLNVIPLNGIFQLQDGFIFFHGDTSSLTDVTIAYFGLNVDDTGLMKAYEDYERAVIGYICWKYALQNFDKYPANVKEDYHREWQAQKKWVKSTSAQNEARRTKAQLTQIMNSIISDKSLWSN